MPPVAAQRAAQFGDGLRLRATPDRVETREVMDGGGADIFVVGNAPTALYRLLERIGRGGRAPALIVGMPVGFVNAAEAKELLLAQDAIPYITIVGRKGGSSLAASVINALAKLARAGRSV